MAIVEKISSDEKNEGIHAYLYLPLANRTVSSRLCRYISVENNPADCLSGISASIRLLRKHNCYDLDEILNKPATGRFFPDIHRDRQDD